MIDALDLLEIGKTKILKPDSLYQNKTGFLEEKILDNKTQNCTSRLFCGSIVSFTKFKN